MNPGIKNKDEYVKVNKTSKKLKEMVNNDPLRLHYHLMPPTGWLNDPNGLIQHNGIYHIYYQYTPFYAGWGNKIWGHYTTKDWLNFKEEEPFLYPDHEDDRDGAYSGCAYIKDNQFHYFYTGNVKLHDKSYDYIMNGREQNTIHITSLDGYHYENKVSVLKNKDYPSHMSCHVRDPKVYEKNGAYHMVLGARDDQDQGCALLYKSKDLTSWEFEKQIYATKKMGYMWECPDIFNVDNQDILLTCIQGLDHHDDHYQNIFSVGYFTMNDELGEFKELDYGFDFYACQTFKDDKNRRIMLGWMGLPEEAGYNNEPSVNNGWIHALTMPRVLHYKDNHLYQVPLEEMKLLRKDHQQFSFTNKQEFLSENSVFELQLSSSFHNLDLQLRDDVHLFYKDHLLTLKLGKSGYGRKVRHLKLDQLHNLRIFSDTSSLEIFINDGQYTMTTRVYSELKQNIVCHCDTHCKMDFYPLSSYNLSK
ncbi:glycoside hydrolase family 32 protein [Kandleria vitulina]|jgi:beta-fructofuranosidase|uniref:glycoside hydrolase family 32 protein n=1 Tax=Kandleria vitulina TaxID=1630 RepID=UPI00333299C0